METLDMTQIETYEIDIWTRSIESWCNVDCRLDRHVAMNNGWSGCISPVDSLGYY